MKFVLLFLFLHVGVVFSQDLSIRVMSDNAPVEHASLFVNNRWHGVADAKGLIHVCHSVISEGDILVVTMAGMETKTRILKNKDFDLKELVITLTPNLVLDEVVVLGRDKSEQLLRRYVKDHFTAIWGTRYKGNYKMNINNKVIEGEFMWSQYPEIYAKERNLEYVE